MDGIPATYGIPVPGSGKFSDETITGKERASIITRKLAKKK